ncbi:MAG TPA: hypothetical protein VGH28_13740 [Polyangiaceae bacterium]|jgi:hypothetical protein
MSQLPGWVVDPLKYFAADVKAREAERRSRIAYRAWVEASARVGVNVEKPWEELLQDEKAQWSDVYGVCCRADLDHEAGVS